MKCYYYGSWTRITLPATNQSEGIEYRPNHLARADLNRYYGRQGWWYSRHLRHGNPADPIATDDWATQ